MTAPTNPTAFGLRPVASRNGTLVADQTLKGAVPNLYATNIPFGAPLKIAAGVLTPAAAGDAISGVMKGFEGLNTGIPKGSLTYHAWLAGGNYPDALKFSFSEVDASTVYEIVVNGTVAETALGGFCDITVPASDGAAAPHVSGVYVATGDIDTTNTRALKIVGVSTDTVFGGWGKANTILRVVTNLPGALSR